MHGTTMMERGGWQNKANAWKTLPVNYPSQSHWPQQTPHLADRWPGKCILQKLERPGAQYPFSKNGQVSRALHEKRVKYIPTTKVGGIEQASCRDEKIISVVYLFGSKHKQQKWDLLATIDMFNLIMFTLHRSYWLFGDFLLRFWTYSQLLGKKTIPQLLL